MTLFERRRGRADDEAAIHIDRVGGRNRVVRVEHHPSMEPEAVP